MTQEDGPSRPKPWAPNERERHLLPDGQFTTIGLARFAPNGKLCPTLELERDAMGTVFSIRRGASVGDFRQENAVVFALNFEGVNSITEEIVFDVVQPALTILSGVNNPTTPGIHVFLENVPVNVARAISRVLQSEKMRGRKIVAARLQGNEGFDIIGNPSKIERFTPAWQALQQEDDWVEGQGFSRLMLGEHEGRKPTLNDMFMEGIIAKHTTPSSTSFFRVFTPKPQ